MAVTRYEDDRRLMYSTGGTKGVRVLVTGQVYTPEVTCVPQVLHCNTGPRPIAIVGGF
jgi:hypothetical protein